mmetsp:Transcript_1587/g.5516  ORF Transcript_1587/g.5516 Transcript_1587/m.5516 type:complete len:729 (+) Transcript_1587:142-2328(+)
MAESAPGVSQHLRRASWIETTSTIVAFMAFPLSMPVAFGRSGWVFGTLATSYIALVTWETGLLLGKICRLLPHLGDYPSIAEEAFGAASASSWGIYVRYGFTWSTTGTRPQRLPNGKWGTIAPSFSLFDDEEQDDAERTGQRNGAKDRGTDKHREGLPASGAPTPRGQSLAWRRFGRWSTLLMQFLTYYLQSVVGIIYIEQYFIQLFPNTKICQSVWIIIVFVVMSPFIQIPTFKDSWWATVTALGTLFANIFIFFYQVFLVRPWECTPGPSYDCFSCNGLEDQSQCGVCSNIDAGTQRTLSDALESVTLISYSFGGHGLYPETIREMQNTDGWPLVMHVTYLFVLPLYLVSGLVGFYAYGTFANANINVNWPDNPANKVSILANMLNFGYTLIISTLLQVLQVEIALGVDPTAWCATPVFSEGGFFSRMPPVLFRVVFRTMYFASQVFIAEMLLAGEGDTLFALQSLCGSVGMVAFTFFLPFIFHMALHGTSATSSGGSGYDTAHPQSYANPDSLVVGDRDIPPRPPSQRLLAETRVVLSASTESFVADERLVPAIDTLPREGVSQAAQASPESKEEHEPETSDRASGQAQEAIRRARNKASDELQEDAALVANELSQLVSSSDISAGGHALVSHPGMTLSASTTSRGTYWGRYSRSKRMWHGCNIVLGIVIMILGLVFSIKDLASSSNGFFQGSCDIEYKYSPQDSRDPCYVPEAPPSPKVPPFPL